MEICVEIQGDKTIMFDAEPTDIIANVKAKIEDKMGIPYSY